MGVNDLWKLWREDGLMQEWSVETDGQGAQKAVAEQIEGKVVAVDISLWACQATTQLATAELWTEEGRVVKMAFDRVINYLRFGCSLVGVLDGQAPAAKLATLQSRFYMRFNREGGGYGNDAFISQCQAIAKLFSAMGLWVVQAPGEAEATCAALNRGGYVDACVTNDSDVLLFGAETVFHTLRPLTGTPNQCVLAEVHMGSVREHLGICSGGTRALIAMALLLGGDYHMRGAENIGPKLTLAVVRHLLESRSNDDSVVQALSDFLQTPAAEHEEILSLDKCTGCKRCGHEGHRKNKIQAHSARNTCPHCPPGDDGRCRERECGQCGCAFHRLEKQRIVIRALQRIKATPGFIARASAAHEEYLAQMEDAERAVHSFCELHGHADRMTWRHRPDLQQLYSVISRSGIEWEAATLRGKVMPLLMEWDASRPHTQAEFVPTGIVKLHGGAEDTCWRYLVAWKRTAVGSAQDRERDQERLDAKGKTTDGRALRISTVREQWPDLVERYEAKRAADTAKKAGKPAKSAAAPDRATAGMAARMQAFLVPRSVSAPTKAAAGAATEGRGLGSLAGPQHGSAPAAPAQKIDSSAGRQPAIHAEASQPVSASPQKTPSKRRSAADAQAASCAGEHLSAEPQTPFSSPGKRLKPPPASPAVHLIPSSPKSPDLASLPGRLPGSCRNHPHHAAHTAAPAPPGNAEVAHRSQVGHAGSSASLEGPGQRAQGHVASTSAPARQQAVVGDASLPLASRAPQGMSTPAQPQQVRHRHVARKTSASIPAGAENTTKKSHAQAALGSHPIDRFFTRKATGGSAPSSSRPGQGVSVSPHVIDLSQASPELQTPQIARDAVLVVPTASTGPDIVLDLITPPSNQQERESQLAS